MSRPGRLRRALLRAGRLAAAYLASRRAGAMLIAGAVATGLVLVPTGGLMANYAWREAQWQELRAAVRAAVSVTGARLAGAGTPEGDRAISERVAEVLTGLSPGFSADGVTVAHDAVAGVTTISVAGSYVFDNIWSAGSDGGSASAVAEAVRVRFERDRYEVAVALDATLSMAAPLSDGVSGIDAARTAIEHVADAMEVASASDPGSLMVSVVPFGVAVNVADTCNPDAVGNCRADRSRAKETYVRMLAGVRDTMSGTLADARAARGGGNGHWVDTYHHYGAGVGLGELRHRYLPQALLDDVDWNLRRTRVAVDVSEQVPGRPVWAVNDEDFWNGCVMARWGAYWHVGARPPGWRADDTRNWPARQAVAAWAPRGAGLPANTPLHLSDAPPDASAPATLFTAYSWPDAGISGIADHRLQGAMMQMLDDAPYFRGFTLDQFRTTGDNDWSARGRAGSALCPQASITPLTDDIDALRTSARRLAVVPNHSMPGTSVGGTYPHLGIVWGLRALSPLWAGVWSIKDRQGNARPGTPCPPDDTQGLSCDATLQKSILFVSDGRPYFASALSSRMHRRLNDANQPVWYEPSPFCDANNHSVTSYHEAEAEVDPDAFNARFRAPFTDVDYVDGSGRLNDEGRAALVEAIVGIHDPGPDTDARREAMIAALATAAGGGLSPTPWQVFRGLDRDVLDELLKPGSAFGLAGRPVQIGHGCRPTSIFGSYGRIDDHVYIGEVGATAVDLPLPARDAAPFGTAGLAVGVAGDGTPGTGDFGRDRGALFDEMNARLARWFLEGCALAGARGVRINAIYIGRDDPISRPSIDLIEQCVDRAGGDPQVADVYVTPEENELVAAFTELFTVRRNLRFLD